MLERVSLIVVDKKIFLSTPCDCLLLHSTNKYAKLTIMIKENIMDKYPDYISEKRRPVASPKCIVQDGQSLFGTFATPIENLNFLDCVKPCGKLLPHALNKIRFTKWEALEVMLDEGTLLSAVYHMGMMGFSIFVYFDKTEKKTYSWVNFTQAKNCIVAPNLIDSVTTLTTKNSFAELNNEFQNGLCRAKGNSKNKKSGAVEFELKLSRISPPSIVNIPFGSNKPLYSEKDFFKAEGYIVINGKKILTNDNSTSIIDDHKGYYPFKAHYDWLTTMGKTEIDGEQKYLAINFTRNQSINQDDYNENLLWLENQSCPIPPVKFEKISKNKWKVTDEHNTVEVYFDIEADFKMMTHLGILDISYTLPFGKVSGYVHDTNGKKYIIDGMYGIGEDKSTRI
ncbi:MAG: DUF2804 domain-containing protein [Clostridia bacterium]|nr:DUF2804 domain-containing protein [Clostridia bacterium]